MSHKFKEPHQIELKELKRLFPGINLEKIRKRSRLLNFQIGEEHSAFTLKCLKKKMSSQELFENKSRFLMEKNIDDFFNDRKGFAAALVTTNDFSWIVSARKIYDIRSFVGLAGQASSFHFDWNLCENILINLEGEKTYRFFPPNRSQELNCVGNFTISKIKPTLEIRLSKGEALYLPPLWWHQAYYHTDATACSIRLHPNHELQKIMKFYYPSWKVIAALSKMTKLQCFELPRLNNVTQYIHNVEDFLNQSIDFSGRDSKQYSTWCEKYVSYKTKNREIENALSRFPKI